MSNQPNPTSLTVEQRHLNGAQEICAWLDLDWQELNPADRQAIAIIFARFEADHLTSTDRLRDALEPFAAMATEMERVAAQHGIHPSKVGRSHSYEHCVAAREALTSTPAPSSEREALERLTKALAKVSPITTHDTPDYAELSFGEHQTQAMTVMPADWQEIEAAFQAARAALQGHAS